MLDADSSRRVAIFLDEIHDVEETEIGHVFSARNIVRFLKSEHRTTTVETVLTYLRACEDAFLFSKVPREDLIGKHVLSVDEKYYVSDLGMRRAIVGDLHGGDVDQMLENLVYREMVRRGWIVTIGRVREKEVDFVCRNHDERLYIRVCYLMSEPATREREFSALESIPDQYPKLVLSMDRLNFSRNGVKHRFLPDFLLNAEPRPPKRYHILNPTSALEITDQPTTGLCRQRSLQRAR